jgi:NADH:ubiquinone oxidoreductase subunit F (NADH-binding)/NAD-dependent dihydropyrimidine dehydrogenase PreA subunit
LISNITKIAYCVNKQCPYRRDIDVRTMLMKALYQLSLADKVDLVETECLISCQEGPSIMLLPSGRVAQVNPEHNFTQWLIANIAALYHSPHRPSISLRGDAEIPPIEQMDFFSKQELVVMRNRGHIDAENLEEYIAHEGYIALNKVLTALNPEDVIKEIKASGLRGRGGAGFPTGLKWEEARKYNSFPKYVICNGDEGDPGAFMDRSLMESDPHSVIEGMIICGYAIGAQQGYIYVRAEYPLAVRMLQTAIDKAKEKNLLGKNIMKSGFNFNIGIYPGAGAFVCGESTALMYSIEGKRGMPRIKPPRSTESGLWGKPTCLNNVETFANVTRIIRQGADWFKSLGTPESPGTKVFSLTGAVRNVGLVEVPMGITLRSLIFEIGGGIKGNGKFKAVQLGGPSGGCLTDEHLDIPVTFDSLQTVGAMMGSGGIVVMDDSNCMVDVARFFTQFSVDESCGKCVPCRTGLSVVLGILEKIITGQGVPEDLHELETLAHHIANTSHCGLGQSAANPVLSTLRYFRDEYEAHIYDKRCPALVCTDLISFEIDEPTCRRCGLCAKVCPAGAVTWKKKEVPMIDKTKCTRCKSCIRACKFKSIY